GDAALGNDVAAHLSAVLTEDGTTPLAGRTVSLALGSGASRQTCSATTDASGLASCSPGATGQPLGQGGVSASFSGDQFYAASLMAVQVDVTVVSAATVTTTTTTSSTTSHLAITGHARPVSPPAALVAGALLLVAGLFLFIVPRRRRGRAPPIVWRNST